jgi:adenine phosphoribosyltransferase
VTSTPGETAAVPDRYHRTYVRYAQRVAYNWALARVRANWEQRAAEQTYGLTGDQLTPWVDTSAYGLRMAWNAVKREVAPWWAENSKEAYASGCANLAAALGNRKEGRARMPRFHSKRRSRLTSRFTVPDGGGQDKLAAVAPAVDIVAGVVEARGFLLGAAVGYARGTGIVGVRKPGRLPVVADRESYTLEYGAITLELADGALGPGPRVLVIDDVLATGGTIAATCALVGRAGAEVVGIGVVVEIAALGGRGVLADRPVQALLTV